MRPIKKIDKRLNNIVIIGGRNEEICEHSILIRMHPRVYNKYGCIKIQVMSSLLNFAEVIINRFNFAGLNELTREKKEIDKGDYVLKDAWEITLELIPALQLKAQDWKVEQEWKKGEKDG